MICVMLPNRTGGHVRPDDTSETDMADDPTLAGADARPRWVAPHVTSVEVIRTLAGSGTATDLAIGSHDAHGSTSVSAGILE